MLSVAGAFLPSKEITFTDCHVVPDMKLALLLSLTVVLSAAHHARALTELSDWSEGLATFYGGAPDGAPRVEPWTRR